MENKRSSEDGRKMLEEFERSGLTRREYCDQNHVPITTLDYWRWKKNKETKPGLVKVTVEGEQPSPGFSVMLANGRRIESSWSFRETELARVIRVAETA